MAVSRDVDGWTVVTLEGASKAIYVSSSLGNDANPGTFAQPKATIAGALQIAVGSDMILLRRGDAFRPDPAVSIGGWLYPVPSGTLTRPTVIGAYGDGANAQNPVGSDSGPRPIIYPQPTVNPDTRVFSTGAHIYYLSLEINGAERDFYQNAFVWHMVDRDLTNVLIEDVLVTECSTAFTATRYQGGAAHDSITIRRSVIEKGTLLMQPGAFGIAGGIYMDGQQGTFLCEDVVFGSNGYNGDVLASITATAIGASGENSTITVAGAGWTVDQWKWRGIRFTTPGQGYGYTAAIVSNTSDTITIYRGIDNNFGYGAGSTFDIIKVADVSLGQNVYIESSSAMPTYWQGITFRNCLFYRMKAMVRSGGLMDGCIFAKMAGGAMLGGANQGIPYNSYYQNCLVEGSVQWSNVYPGFGVLLIGGNDASSGQLDEAFIEGCLAINSRFENEENGVTTALRLGAFVGGLERVTVRNNRFVGFDRPFVMQDHWPSGGVTAEDNIISHPDSGTEARMLDAGAASPTGTNRWSGNEFYSGRGSGTWFYTGSANRSNAAFESSVSSSGLNTFLANPPTFSDSTRGFDTYDSVVMGGVGTFDALIEKVSANRKGDYDIRLTTIAINDWIRAGFDMPPLGEGPITPTGVGRKSEFLADRVLDRLLKNDSEFSYSWPATLYLGLLTTAPLDEGDLLLEVADSGYSRQSISFGTISDSSVASSGRIIFPKFTTTTGPITYVGVYGSAEGSDLLYYIELTDPVTVLAGNSIAIQDGQITVTED